MIAALVCLRVLLKGKLLMLTCLRPCLVAMAGCWMLHTMEIHQHWMAPYGTVEATRLEPSTRTRSQRSSMLFQH